MQNLALERGQGHAAFLRFGSFGAAQVEQEHRDAPSFALPKTKELFHDIEQTTQSCASLHFSNVIVIFNHFHGISMYL